MFKHGQGDRASTMTVVAGVGAESPEMNDWSP